MKKWFLFCVLLVISFVVLCDIEAKSKSTTIVAFDDVTTLNFQDKTAKYNIESIMKICTYDFCDYVRGQSKTESIEIFTRNYLKNVDKEVAANLRVKGVRITSIELK